MTSRDLGGADWCERESARGLDRKAEFGEERDSGPGKAKSLAQVIGMRNDVQTGMSSERDVSVIASYDNDVGDPAADEVSRRFAQRLVSGIRFGLDEREAPPLDTEQAHVGAQHVDTRRHTHGHVGHARPDRAQKDPHLRQRDATVIHDRNVFEVDDCGEPLARSLPH